MKATNFPINVFILSFADSAERNVETNDQSVVTNW